LGIEAALPTTKRFSDILCLGVVKIGYYGRTDRYMGIRLEELIIVDIEATCWERGKKPPEQRNEIIEVGICLFNLKAWGPKSKHQIIVKPVESKVSEYCTKLTGWTQEELDSEGIPLVDACNILTSVYNSKQRLWASWGDYDRLQFWRECDRKAIPYPFGVKHMNLKTLYAIHRGWVKECGMADALNLEGLTLEGRHHKGIDDAWNIGRILESQGRF
jgi:inhibitor of KinA sporulation pathway (predicted exonuclease)